MKKNMMVIGMLVALLTIPANMFAQEVASTDAALAAQNTTDVSVKKEKKVREPRVQVIDSLHYSYGSVISAYFGLGNSGLWATNGTAQLQNSWGFPGFSVGARYSYFFLNWLGFTTGIDYSTYSSTIKMQGIYINKGMTTDMNYAYEHSLKFSGDQDPTAPLSTWEENEYLGMLEVPIALTFRYKPNKVGFISTLGLKMGFPIVGRYGYKGTLNRYGWSNQFNYFQKNDQYLVSNESYDQTLTAYRKGTWSVINAEAFGEIGAVFQLADCVDLSLSVYGGYCMNDVNRTDYNARQDLGFQLINRNPQANMAAMPAYQGMIGTKAIDHVNPWNCGVKIGVHIYTGDENDAARAARLAAQTQKPTELQIVYVRDTLTLRDTVTIHDTVMDLHKQVSNLLQKVVIYYKVGDATTPIVKPSNLLKDAATIIAANPSIRVSVEGHASSDGDPVMNQKLSEERAQNVVKILRQYGIKDSQVEIKAYGSSHPLTYGDQNDPNRDRRVEIIPIYSE